MPNYPDQSITTPKRKSTRPAPQFKAGDRGVIASNGRLARVIANDVANGSNPPRIVVAITGVGLDQNRTDFESVITLESNGRHLDTDRDAEPVFVKQTSMFHPVGKNQNVGYNSYTGINEALAYAEKHLRICAILEVLWAGDTPISSRVLTLEEARLRVGPANEYLE